MDKKQQCRMSNKEWKELLSEQFGVSKTTAKEMLHGMMQWKNMIILRGRLIQSKRIRRIYNEAEILQLEKHT